MIKLNIKFIYTNTKLQNGGLKHQEKNLAYYLNGVIGIIGTDTFGNKYIYDIADDTYNNKQLNNISEDRKHKFAKFLNNGAISIVIVIKLNNIKYINGVVEDYSTENILHVLKLSVINQITNDEEIFNTKYMDTYLRYYNMIKNSIIETYYYGNNIEDSIQEPEDINDVDYISFKKLIDNYKIVFTISKYYQERITDIDLCLINGLLLVYYVHFFNHVIIDFRNENYIFVDNKLVIIDYDIHVLSLYKVNNKDILFNNVRYNTKLSNYLKVFFYCALCINNQQNNNYYLQQINEAIELDIVYKGLFNKKSLYTDIYFSNLLKDNYEKIPSNITKKDMYYESKLKLFFKLSNYITIFEIIIKLWFKSFDYEGLFNDKFLTRSDKYILTMNKIHTEFISRTFYFHMTTFQNTNDVDILIKLLYGVPIINSDGIISYNNPYIEPLYTITLFNIDELKKFIFDPLSETGIMAPTQYNLPPYILALMYLMILLNEKDEVIIYSKFKTLLNDSIGTSELKDKTVEQLKEDFLKQLEDLSPREISKITTINGLELTIADYNDLPDKSQFIITQFTIEEKRQLTYEKWSDTRHLLQLTEDPYFRSDEEIMLPPVNSKFKQNEFLLFNGYRIYKWIFNDIKQPIINPFWVQLLTILGLISPFIIESNTVYNLNITQLKSLNDYLGLTINRFTLDEAIIIILPTQITLRTDQPYHPFIIKHSGERHIEDVNLPINTSHTFTLEYCRKVFRQIKGPIYIKLKNTRNEEMLKRLKQELDQSKYKQKLDEKFRPVKLGLEDKSPKYQLSKSPIIPIGRMKKKFRKGTQDLSTDRNSEKSIRKKEEREITIDRKKKQKYKEQQQLYNKYLKYKTKYLNLKSLLNIF